MPTSVWTGALSLGLVVVPVRLYPAVRKKHVRFHELDRSGRRVRHVRIAEPEVDFAAPPARLSERSFQIPETAAAPEVAYEEIRKGYEVAPGQYVSMTREEVAELAPQRIRVIDVQQFVDVSAVDPIYFESRYYVVPDRDSIAAFRILRQAMTAADRMAIAWFTLRSRRYLSAIRPFRDLMLLTTMVHADEIAAADFFLPDADSAPTDREIKMARLLVDTLSGPFEPEHYPDEHRQRVLDAVAERTTSAAEPEGPPSPTRIVDLMAALEASVKAARAARASQERKEPGSRRLRRNAR